MRCKKHPVDQSSSNGVCATCLRERLLAVISAQAKAQAQEEPDQARQKPVIPPPPPLLFPRSVSPYISLRKSDTASVAATSHHHHRIKSYHSLPDRKFFSTPQIGPTGGLSIDHQYKKKKNKFNNLFSKLFRSKSDKPEINSDPRVPESRSTAISSSPAWFPNFLSRKKERRTLSVDELAIRRLRRDHRHRDRGMSPAMDSDEENEAETEPSGYNSDDWRNTPRRTPVSVCRRGGGRNVSGISFCLSPMVRANPGQNWNYKGGAVTEMAVSGEIRLPIKSHSITAATLGKNRSRKLADIGRSNHNR